MSPDVVYVSGRTRKPGEMNGKSANLNNCLGQIYPAKAAIPAHEIVCIFDADQVGPPRALRAQQARQGSTDRILWCHSLAAVDGCEGRQQRERGGQARSEERGERQGGG